MKILDILKPNIYVECVKQTIILESENFNLSGERKTWKNEIQ